MSRRAFRRITSAARLRLLLALMFLGFAIPAVLLVRQGFARLSLEEFRRQQLIAEAVLQQIDTKLTQSIAVENGRPVTDFQFAGASGAADSGVGQVSPLSSIAPAGAFPGTIGYFQVDAEGELSTPLLPESANARRAIDDGDIRQKVELERQVADVLEKNKLVRTASTARSAPSSVESAIGGAAQGQAAFDQLSAKAVGALQSQHRSDEAQAAPRAARAGGAPGDAAGSGAAEPGAGQSLQAIAVSSFAGEIEPLRFSLLETGQFVLFRNAWRDGQRYVQGLLVDRDALIRDSFAAPFRDAGFAPGTRLAISVAGQAVSTLGDVPDGAQIDGSTLYTARLSPPLSDLALDFTAGRLDHGPGFDLLVWTTIALAAVLFGGFASMYLFGMQQLKLAREQRNFVSAVSHELKTPLTSIRMYGEMLKSGWADEEKKQTYYDFIVGEGERLSRLIENVLQLARFNNGGTIVDAAPVGVGEIFDLVRSKLGTQAERAGFALEFDVPADVALLCIAADTDALTQVFINLVDNAIKFSSEAAEKKIVLAARRRGADRVLLTVRDFGPGVPPAGLKRLFELFYRPDNELTRSTTGTGIGLALVRQLVTAMGARIDVRNCEPGAEFSLSFPYHSG